MKIAILSMGNKLYSTRRLAEAATARGHDVHILNTLKCYLNVSSTAPGVYYQGQRLEGFDAVIPRIGASITSYGLAVLRQFEILGVFPLNESVAIGRARDKLRTYQLLARKGIRLPATSFAHDVETTQDLIELVGGAPVVVKLLEGSQGKGVVLAETQPAAESVIDAFRELRAHFLVQEFVAEAGGADLRCLVVGDHVVAVMKRQAEGGEFRSNLHRGGSATTVRITEQERRVAVRAAKIVGLHVAGVDLLRAQGGPLVLEVNASPGLEGIETVTGKDVAGRMIRYLEKKARRNDTRTRGKG